MNNVADYLPFRLTLVTPFYFMKSGNKLWLLFILFITTKAISQTCPPNIGFEDGSFKNWECYTGTVARNGTLSLTLTSPIDNKHTIISNTSPQGRDPYGGFPTICPNGSGNSVRLGNSSAGGEAEGLSYTFTIPANNNDYSLIYNYAVVFENPNHLPSEQPRFISKIYNVTDNKYIDCGSFEFVASSNLPGFQDAGGSVFFKPWSPVTVNLSGLAGKTVRLEFTTNDCAFVRHFGYAYLDVNEDCNFSPITGNTYCGNQNSLTLTAPFGFAGYNWYNANFTQLLGTNSILTLTPPPADNTVFALEVIPYDGLGCKDTLYTTIHESSEPFNLVIKDSVSACSTTGADLTAFGITAGSTTGLTYSYFTDLSQLSYVPTPKAVIESGTYYIKGVNQVGCNDIKPIVVTAIKSPTLNITNPAGVCAPLTVDITTPAITAGSENDLSISYWRNLAATQTLNNANALKSAGTYYIKGVNNTTTCFNVQPVIVKIGAVPTVIIHDAVACGQANLTAAAITAGSTPGLAFNYFTDAAATNSLQQPNAIINTGTYYIKATTQDGCSMVRSVNVTINPIPDFTVTDPEPINYPIINVDITRAVVPVNNLVYTYWKDSLATKSLPNPTVVNKRGRYFIKATNQYGCSRIQAVNVIIIPSLTPIIFAPTAFTPNSDRLNDTYRIKVLGEITIKSFKIYNRWGQVVYNSIDFEDGWDGKLNQIEQPGGAYVWILEGYDEYYKKVVNAKGLITLIR